ncbi:MAG: enoyl-CoA hydratase-related protein [Bradymonadaceae bacterium]
MPDVLYEKRDEHVVDITLNRPEARNAYSDTMVDELVGSLDRAEDDPDVHAVVLSGAGESFSAGGDLKAMRDRSGMFEGDPVDLRNNYRRGLHRVPRRFDDFEKPVVAAIDGPAIGAGLDLALMCDLRIAAESATFGSTFARVGVVPGDGGAYLLARAVGFSTAVELILTARLVDADEALDIDLVHRVVEDGEVDATARPHRESPSEGRPDGQGGAVSVCRPRSEHLARSDGRSAGGCPANRRTRRSGARGHRVATRFGERGIGYRDWGMGNREWGDVGETERHSPRGGGSVYAPAANPDASTGVTRQWFYGCSSTAQLLNGSTTRHELEARSTPPTTYGRPPPED